MSMQARHLCGHKTIVYVDGFNLYYGLKKANAKWLDIGALCDRLLVVSLCFDEAAEVRDFENC